MKFLICASGSGGHIYPALSFANELKNKAPDADIMFLTSVKSLDKELFKQSSYKVFTQGFIRFSLSEKENQFKFFLKNLYFLLKFIKESIRVFFLVRSLTPDLVIGFGGIGSVAAVVSAKNLNIPTLIHEQNIVPGLANRLLAKIATKTSASYVQSLKFFRQHNPVITGNILRCDLKKLEKRQARSSLELDEDKFTVFVFGGSQGAEFINRCFLETVKKLEENERHNLQVIHSFGKGGLAAAEKQYLELGIGKKLFTYCDLMNNAYSAADLVICRAGAGTLGELSYFNKAAILIPYPHARAHQKRNALFMQDIGAACIIEENEYTCIHLLELLKAVIKHPEMLAGMEEKSQLMKNDEGVSRLASLAVGLAKK